MELSGFRQVPVGTAGETSLVVDVLEPKAAEAPERKTWPASTKLLRQAMEAFGNTELPKQPYGADGPTDLGAPRGTRPRRVLQKPPRRERRDPKKRQNAKRQAWNRAVEAAREAKVIGFREIDGEGFLWFA